MAGFFFVKEINPDPQELIAKGMTARESWEITQKVLSILGEIKEMKVEIIEPVLRDLVEQSAASAGQIFGIMRVAITGQKVSPPLFESMEIIGKTICIRRLEDASKILKELSDKALNTQ
jgi:glutamyl-tRNA synthetase